MIDYRVCIRDLLKFISYNEIDYKFNRWYFLSNLADIKQDGTAIIDTSVVEAISALYSFNMNYTESEDLLAVQGLMMTPSDNMNSVEEKAQVFGNENVRPHLEEAALDPAFRENFPSYIAPGLAKRVTRNFFDLYHYWELLDDPDNQSTINTFDQITNRLEPSRRALKLLNQSRRIVDVAIAQQTLLSGDTLLLKLEPHFKASYTVPSLTESGVLGRISENMALDPVYDTNFIASKHPVILSNIVRARIYNRLKNYSHTTYAYAYLNADSSMLQQLIDSGFEYRIVEEGNSRYWEVKFSFTNSSSPSDPNNYEAWVRLPTPTEFLERKLLVTPDLEELVAIQNGFREEVLDYQAYMDAETEVERKSFLFSVLSSVH